MKIIDVKVDQIELIRIVKNLFHHQSVMCNGIDAIGIEPKRFFARGNQPCVGYRVATGKQGNVVPEQNELLREPGDDSLRSPIKSRRNAFIKWRDLGNPHALTPFRRKSPTYDQSSASVR